MRTVPATLAERCRGIELLVLDVDGVLTEGGIVYGNGGLEVKEFHVRDGSGLKLWQQAGRRSALITGRSSPVVDVRAAELGVDLSSRGRPTSCRPTSGCWRDAALPPGGLLRRRRPAGPAAAAPVRPGRGRRRRLPGGADAAHYVTARAGRPGGRARGDRVDPALPGRVGPADGAACAIRSSESGGVGKGRGHVDPQADLLLAFGRRSCSSPPTWPIPAASAASTACRRCPKSIGPPSIPAALTFPVARAEAR